MLLFQRRAVTRAARVTFIQFPVAARCYAQSVTVVFTRGIAMHTNTFAAVLAALSATAASATAPQFHAPAAASAAYSVSTRVYGDLDYTRDSGTGTGSRSVGSGNSSASAGAGYAPIPFAAAYVTNGSGSGSSGATATLTYEYVFLARDGAAASELETYLAAHAGVGASIAGHIDLVQNGQYGTAIGRIDAGTGVTEFKCGVYYYRSASQCGNYAVAGTGSLARLGGSLAFNGFITLFAAAGLSEGGSSGGGGIAPGPNDPPVGDDSFSAYVDPIIGLVSGFDPLDFTLSLSPGVANTSGGTNPFGGGGGGINPPPGVPEPGNWALLIAGFGLTGAAARRRRMKTVAA